MYLGRISIKNFRGIKSLEMRFDPSLTVIMGENNAGKSSLLGALDICLNQLRSEKGSLFDLHDFHLDESHLTIDSCEPIRITVSFEETENNQWTPAEKQRLNDIDVGVEYSEIHLQIEASYDSSNRGINQSVNFLDKSGIYSTLLDKCFQKFSRNMITICCAPTISSNKKLTSF